MNRISPAETLLATRSRLVRVAVACTFAFSAGCSQSPGPELLQQEPPRFLKGGDSYTTSIKCRVGELTLVRAHQDNIDVVLSTVGKEGAIQESDFPTGRFGDEFIVSDCDSGVLPDISIRNRSKGAPGGEVTVSAYSLARVDSAIANAYRKLATAGQINASPEPSWSSLVDELLAARKAWASDSSRKNEAALTEFALSYVQYMKLNSWLTAASYAERAAKMFADIRDEDAQALAFQLRGATLEEAAYAAGSDTKDYERKKTYGQSESLLRAAIDIQTKRGRKFDAAMSANYLAICFYYQGKEAEAMEAFANVQKDFGALGEHVMQAAALQNLATVYYEKGSYGLAQGYFEQLLPLLTPDDDPYIYASTVHNYAQVLSVLGYTQSSLAYENKALTVFQSSNILAGQARSLRSLGLGYARVGELDRALDFQKRSLETIRKRADLVLADKTSDDAAKEAAKSDAEAQRRQYFSSQLDASENLLALGKPADAARLIDEAAKNAVTGLEQKRLALARGFKAAAQKKWAEAVQYLKVAAVVDAEVQNPYAFVAEVELSRAYRELGSGEEARLVIAKALADSTKNASALDQAQALKEKHHVSLLIGQPSVAKDDLSRALTIYETLSLRTSSDSLRAAALANRREAYRLMIQLIVNEELKEKDLRAGVHEGAARESLLVADRSRSHSFVRLRSFQYAPKGDAAGARQLQLFDELAGRKAILRNLLDADRRDEARIKSIRQQVTDLQTELDSSGATERADVGQANSFLSSDRLDELRRQLGKNDLILEFILAGGNSWCWRISESEIELIRLPSAEVLAATIARLRAVLNQDSSINEVTQRVDALRQALSPAMNVDGFANVYVVPDGALHYVPFQLLTADSDEHAPVFMKIPSLSALNKKDDKPDWSPNQTIAIFAGADAPAVKAEITEIRTAFATEKVYEATAIQNSRRGFLDFNFAGKDIIHFAGHGAVDRDVPELSQLVFKSDAAGEVLDSVRAIDLSKMRIHADLFVVSACESGSGKLSDGEGLMGIANSLLAGGATSVLVSQWPVPDRATSELMGKFYKRLNQDRQGPARALLDAQRELGGSKYAHPYFRNAFEVVTTSIN